MTKQEMSKAVLQAKKAAGLSWQKLSEMTGLAPVYLASCCYGEHSMAKESAVALGKALSLPDPVVSALQEFPTKGASFGDKVVPTDPLIYRFYEIMAVYGLAIKDVVHEKFGDGIMSAVDFTLDVERQEDPKGDRVVVTMSGKFLPYKRW